MISSTFGRILGRLSPISKVALAVTTAAFPIFGYHHYSMEHSSYAVEAKGNDDQPALIKGRPYLKSDYYARPHPSKRLQHFVHLSSVGAGEDAAFMHPYAAGVADGVGGWASVPNANPALFSRVLMHNIKKEINKWLQGNTSIESPNTESIFVSAFESMNIKKTLGSTTSIFVVLDNNTLHVNNLGDSRVLIMRDNKKIHKSSEQQHSFNFPFQVGSKGDSPKSAMRYTLGVKEGDVIILATDGLFDNLFDDEIVDIVNKNENESLKNIAKALVDQAHLVGRDPQATTPFSASAIDQLNVLYQGGKLDDVMCVVAVVKPPNNIIDENVMLKAKL